jgi:hypothetical protein
MVIDTCFERFLERGQLKYIVRKFRLVSKLVLVGSVSDNLVTVNQSRGLCVGHSYLEQMGLQLRNV